MTSKNTPGPWRICDRTSIVADWPEGEVQLCSMATSRWSSPDFELNERMREQTAANVHLIAAAPDLLAACEEAHRAYVEFADQCNEHCPVTNDGFFISVAGINLAAGALSAAIKKATNK